MGVFTNRNPKLKVFDLITGKHLRDVSRRGLVHPVPVFLPRRR